MLTFGTIGGKNMDFNAILFDTRSIQQYIFSGNQLKTNIGASYLVEHLFSDALVRAVEDVCGAGSIDTATWHEEVSPNWEQMETQCRVGYIALVPFPWTKMASCKFVRARRAG